MITLQHDIPVSLCRSADRAKFDRRLEELVGDHMTHGGRKGFGTTKHGRSGHATRSPRFRFLQKLEAKKNDRKDRSRIKDPKHSVAELFHPGKPSEPDKIALDEEHTHTHTRKC